MPDVKIIEISRLQLNRAKDIMKEIPVLISNGAYETAINRSYYAAFHAMKALEALNGYESKKHSGVLSYFRQTYIKTGILDEKLSDIIGVLQESREDSDYNIMIRFAAEDAEEQYQNAKQFVETIDRFLESQYQEKT